jgi:hypothetical protein
MGTLASSPGGSFTISNDLLSQLLVGMRQEAVDNLFVRSVFLDFATKAGAVEREGGAAVWSIPLSVAEHSNITQVISGFEALDMTISDILNPAQYQWCGFHEPIAISRMEELQNSGEAAMVRILQSRMDNVMGKLRREVEKQLVAGTSTVLTRLNTLNGGYAAAPVNNGFLYTDSAGTAGTVGGLARSTALGLSNIVVEANTVTAVDALTDAWIQASAQASKNDVTLILAGASAFKAYKADIYPNEQYIGGYGQKLDGGNLALSFHGAQIVYSTNMNTALTGAASAATNTLDHAFFGINFDGIRLRIHPDADFAVSDFTDFPTQAARGAKFDCMMQLYANHLGSSFAVVDVPA